MEFMKKYDLRFICKVFEWLAVIVFIVGIIVSIFLAISSSYFGNVTTVLGAMILGFVYTFLSSISILFLSRLGGAIDDIRNKECNPQEEKTEQSKDIE